MEALLDGQPAALTQVAIAKALKGDRTALKLCLDRIAPPGREAPIYFDLPPISCAADVVRASAALLAAVARRWEYRADRFALEVTRDLGSLESAFAGLVDANVADLDPPRVVYYLKYTHPTVPERLDALRRTARDEGLEAA